MRPFLALLLAALAGSAQAQSATCVPGPRPTACLSADGQGGQLRVEGYAAARIDVTAGSHKGTMSQPGAVGMSTNTSSSLRDFGAVGDGVADDTDAIQKWLDGLSRTVHGYVPSGVYKFSHVIQSTRSGISISGDGPYQSVFSYDGIVDAGDLLCIGDGISEISNWKLSDFRITSKKRLRSGAAMHLNFLVRSAIDDVVIDGQDGPGNLWNGIWFDGVDFVIVRGFQSVAQHDAVRLNGIVGRGPKADLYISDAKIGGSAVGIHVGGAFGGLFLNAADVIGNNRNVVIDTELAKEGNREIFFGPGVAIDSAKTGCAVTLSDSLANSAAWLQFSGTWLASGPDCGLRIDATSRWIVAFQGGTIFNFKRDGIDNLSQDSTLILDGVAIRGNSIGVKTVQRNEALTNAIFVKNTDKDILRFIPK